MWGSMINYAMVEGRVADNNDMTFVISATQPSIMHYLVCAITVVKIQVAETMQIYGHPKALPCYHRLCIIMCSLSHKESLQLLPHNCIITRIRIHI